jgi:ribosomal protein L11 methyltransferase
VVSALFDLGAEGVQELDDDVVTHIRDVDRSRASAALERAEADAIVEYAATPDVDWSAEWRSRIGAHRVGRLVVTPPWLADRFTDIERIVIEPAMAFGTGEHETTRGVLRLLQQVVRGGGLVADVGAGSAVLSIAAAKLGASRVVAIERDGDAIGNAEENIERNGVRAQVCVLHGDADVLLPLVAPVRVVLANIVVSVLIELLPVVAAAMTAGGVAIFGGVLLEEKPLFERSLTRGGWTVQASDEEGMWWSVTALRP